MSDESDQRARMRRLLTKAGRKEKATPALRASLLALAAIPAVTGTASAATVQGATTAKAATTSIAAWKVATIGAALVAGVAATAVVASRSPSEMPPSESAAIPRAVAPPVSAPAIVEPAPSSSIATMNVSDLPSATKPTGATPHREGPAPSASDVPPAPTPAAPEPASPSKLAEEMKAVEAIRAALRAQTPSEAFRLCEEYRAGFGNGALAEETDVMRIDALAQMGRSKAASDLARRFLEERPKSPYAARVRGIQSRLSEP